MILLILALNLLLNLSDPSNDGYGDGTLLPPTDIIYRSVSAIDIVDFEIKNSPKLSFSISFSDLDKANLKNGFSLPIIEVYFQDSANSNLSNQLLPGSGMRLAENSTWHYAFQITGDYIKAFENTPSGGIKDISLNHLLEITVDGNTINVSTDIATKKNLQSYLIAGNYSAFNKTGWKEISRQANPWAYSSPSQSVAVVDLFAATPEIQKQAIDSAILPAVEAPKDGRNLWRGLMIWGLVLAILGFLAKFLAKSKEKNLAPKTNLAAKARAATIVDNKTADSNERFESELLDKLDIDINEYEKTFSPSKIPDSSEIDISIENIEEPEIQTETKNPNSYKSLAPLALDRLKFDLDETDEDISNKNEDESKDKKKGKIKVYNLAEQNKTKNKKLKDKKPKKQRGEVKKPLVVVPIEEANKEAQAVKNTDNKSSTNQAINSNISYSLGDSFWDNFDDARDVSWKPKK